MPEPKKRQTSIARLIDRARQPTYVLDAQLAIVACNDALAAWVGKSTTQIIGHLCLFRSSGTDQIETDALAGLCPPPSALSQAVDTFLAYRHQDGATLQYRQATTIPLMDEKGVEHWLVAMEGCDRAPDDTPEPEARVLHRRLAALRAQLPITVKTEQLIGDSAQTEQVRARLRIAMDQRPRVLITGPPGTDREDMVRLLHDSDRGGTPGPLIPLECGLLDADMMQHAIIRVKKWLIENPDSSQGWLLLRDVHELSQDAQRELSGFLELPDFELRTLATSVESYEQIDDRDAFDSNLLRRLGTLTIALPALRDRPEDIPLVIQALIESKNTSGEGQVEGCSDAAMDRLVGYHWPNDMDELRQTIDSALESATGVLIESADLPKRIAYAESASRISSQVVRPVNLDQVLSEVEEEMIQRAMRFSAGNKTKAAELLGISRARLHRRTDSEAGPP